MNTRARKGKRTQSIWNVGSRIERNKIHLRSKEKKNSSQLLTWTPEEKETQQAAQHTTHLIPANAWTLSDTASRDSPRLPESRTGSIPIDLRIQRSLHRHDPKCCCPADDPSSNSRASDGSRSSGDPSVQSCSRGRKSGQLCIPGGWDER